MQFTISLVFIPVVDCEQLPVVACPLELAPLLLDGSPAGVNQNLMVSTPSNM